jgi:hypothetical protein
LVAAWRRLRSGRDKAAGWCWFLVALAASLGANISTAGLLDLDDVPAWLRILVAGWPALAFLGGTLLAHGSNEPAAAESSEPVVTAEREPTPSVEPVAEEPPALAPAEPESSAAPVPAALVAHARKVADAHEARTGARIDTATLRARLGVPAPLAEQIVAQLT